MEVENFIQDPLSIEKQIQERGKTALSSDYMA